MIFQTYQKRKNVIRYNADDLEISSHDADEEDLKNNLYIECYT